MVRPRLKCWQAGILAMQVIGRGRMGIVCRAIDQRLGKTVAVKLIAARPAPAAAARFEREMRAIGQLEHPAIVQATDAESIDGCLFLAMELPMA